MSSYEGKKQGSMRKELSEEVLLELRPQVGVGINSAKWVVEAVAVVEEIIIPAEGQNVQTPWGKREHGAVKKLKGRCS